MLLKKDYKAIAEVIHDAYQPKVNPQYQTFERGVNVGCQDIAHRLADYLAQDNSQFDRQKFLDACFKD